MKVSVIMPVYGVENYIKKALESVVDQTLKDIEIFAIDDGSKDKSGQICDELAQRDNRLHVIHQENQGAPVARNTGLKYAKGKYIYFMDADDWIDSDYLEGMYNLAEKYHAELVVTGFLMEYYINGKYTTYETPCPDKTYKSIYEFRKDAYHYLNNSLLSLPWNKLFLRKNIEDNHLRFKKTKWDDHHFCMDYLMDCQSVVLSSMAKYHWYRSRADASTMVIYADPNLYKKRTEHYQHILRLYDHWGIHDDANMSAISSYYVGRLVQCVQEISDNNIMSYKEKRFRINKIINNPLTINAIKDAKTLSYKMKILVFPLKIRNVTLCFILGKGVSLIRKLFPSLFIRLKEHEVHEA